MDYIFRRLALDHLPYEQRAELGILSVAERAAAAGRPGPSEQRGRRPAGGLAQSRRARTAPVAERPAGTGTRGRPGQRPAVAQRRRPAGAHSSTELIESHQGRAADAPLCLTCGTKMRPAGSCYVCEGCGSTSGCS